MCLLVQGVDFEKNAHRTEKRRNLASRAKGHLVTDPPILPHCETLNPLGLTRWEFSKPMGSAFPRVLGAQD